MAKKQNKEWSTLSEAIAIVANAGPEHRKTLAQAYAPLFNSTADFILQGAGAMQSAILKQKQDALAKLQKEVAERAFAASADSKQAKTA